MNTRIELTDNEIDTTDMHYSHCPNCDQDYLDPNKDYGLCPECVYVIASAQVESEADNG